MAVLCHCEACPCCLSCSALSFLQLNLEATAGSRDCKVDHKQGIGAAGRTVSAFPFVSVRVRKSASSCPDLSAGTAVMRYFCPVFQVCAAEIIKRKQIFRLKKPNRSHDGRVGRGLCLVIM